MMKERTRNLIAVGLLAASAIFISIGIYRDEIEGIFRKAVKICLECIGIG